MRLVGFVCVAVMADAQDWDAVTRRAAAIDQETLRMRPVITVFCGEGDWSGQYIGYRDAAGTGWRKIRVISDGGPYTRGVIDLYPALGYEHEVIENMGVIRAGSNWEETRVRRAPDGTIEAERRQAPAKPLLARQRWQAMKEEHYSLLDMAQAHLAAAEDRVVLTGLEQDAVLVAAVEGSEESCDLTVARAFLPVLKSRPDWLGSPVRLRIELKMVRWGRWEGVLTGVDAAP